ncbi:hypothetical protein [Caballeronia sp. J97]|uniref:hypothetical protein n=1 Tax=Caballeronia sp. J97 TaxID=2805429 RepID=UPI002AB24914|nr:hypothetical protein [Caballeronia sp. J97]
MKYKPDDNSGVFSVGQVVEAKFFQEGFPIARSVPADFPVFTASLEHLDYLALADAVDANGPVSLKAQKMKDTSSGVFHLTLTSGAFRVHWLCDAGARELWSALKVWEASNECAFAFMLPESAPYDCLFSKVEFAVAAELEELRPASLESTKTSNSDLVRAMIEARSDVIRMRKKHETASNQCDSINVLMTSRIAQQMRNTPSNERTIAANYVAKTLH